MDVRAKSLIFLRSERWGESLWVGTSARISAWTSAPLFRSWEKKIFRGRLWLHPPLRQMWKCWKTSKTIFTVAILWPVKAIFEERAATVEVDSFLPNENSIWTHRSQMEVLTIENMVLQEATADINLQDIRTLSSENQVSC